MNVLILHAGIRIRCWTCKERSRPSACGWKVYGCRNWRSRVQELRVHVQSSTGRPRISYCKGNIVWCTFYSACKAQAMGVHGLSSWHGPCLLSFQNSWHWPCVQLWLQNLPDDWNCPVCGSEKSMFISKQKEIAGFAENQGYGLGTNSMTGEQKNLLIFGSLAAFFLLFLLGYTMN